MRTKGLKEMVINESIINVYVHIFENNSEMKRVQKKFGIKRNDYTFSTIDTSRKEEINIHHYTFDRRGDIANKKISHRLSRKMLLDAIYKYYPKENVDNRYVENAIFSRINDKIYRFAYSVE